MADSDDISVRASPEVGHLLAWAWLTLVHAAVLVFRLPRRGPAGTWLSAQGFVIAHTLAIGVALAAAVALWRRLPPWSGRAAFPAALAALWAGCWSVLRDDLSGVVTRLPDAIAPGVWHALLSLVVALALVAGHVLGRLLARGKWRVLALLVATAIGAGHAISLPLAYPGLHLIVALGAGLWLAGALAGLPYPRPPPRFALALAATLALAISAGGFVARPSNRTLIELSHQPAAVLLPFVARLLTEQASPFRVPPEQREWFVDRSRLAPVAPSTERPLPEDAIVLMLGIDSLRADVLADERRRASLPNLFALRDSALWFTQARSAGTSTAPSIATLFASRYYSQLYWSEFTKRRPEVFPHSDPTPRFPEVLAARGVPTVTVDTAGWLLNEFGIVRGFTDEQSARVRGYPSAQEAGARLRERLGRHGAGPLFAFIHFLDAHSPYVCGTKQPSPFEAYLACLGGVDSELGEWLELVKSRGLEQRVVWIVFSDHGEAFGEHGLTFHANTLYEELLRVPLLIKAHGLTPQRLDVPVSLVDLGPTVLDALRAPTPSAMMGQSLLPLIAGSSRPLTRPIIAEAQLKRAWITPGRIKVIHDTRRRTLEIFDLVQDPGELDNLVESAPGRHAELPGTLAHFFDVHRHRQPGYETPFRRW